MSAEITPFPVEKARPPLTAAPRPCEPCDLIVVCVNVSHGLWCAFPVAAVDDDGWVTAVLTPHGQRVGVERVACLPERIAFHMSDFADRTTAFSALAFRTWSNLGEAAQAFAELAAVAPGSGR